VRSRLEVARSLDCDGLGIRSALLDPSLAEIRPWILASHSRDTSMSQNR
jgi:hypothetical protein